MSRFWTIETYHRWQVEDTSCRWWGCFHRCWEDRGITEERPGGVGGLYILTKINLYNKQFRAEYLDFGRCIETLQITLYQLTSEEEVFPDVVLISVLYHLSSQSIHQFPRDHHVVRRYLNPTCRLRLSGPEASASVRHTLAALSGWPCILTFVLSADSCSLISIVGEVWFNSSIHFDHQQQQQQQHHLIRFVSL